MKRNLLIILLFFAFTQVYSQSTPLEISKKFFDIYARQDSDKALDYLFSNSPYSKDIEEGIEDVKRQLKKTVGQEGKFYGADLLMSRTAGPNVMMLTYLVRH